jgi:zinc transport system substrate-binding protein
LFKKIILSTTIVSVLFSLCACSSNSVNATSSSKITVVASFNAMSEFVKAIGKDKVNVVTVIPNGTDPHDFEPKIKDLQDLTDAKLFVYNGLGLEKWANSAISSVGNKNLIAVDASKGYPANKVSTSGEYDPHIWLSITGAEAEAKNIEAGLEKADPSNKTYYEANYTSFYNELNALYNEYKPKFSSVKNKNFVTGHAAFGYLCKDFNLTQDSVEDVFADGEPSAQKMDELINTCKKENIKTVFVEDMVSPKVSETLAKEVGASVKKIYTEESKEDNLDYIQAMKANLKEIYNSMK